MTVLSDKMKSDLILQVLKNHLTEQDLTLQEAYNLLKDSPVRNLHLLEFCREICERGKTQEISPLCTIYSQETPPKEEKPLKKWEEWPPEVRDEIIHVLSENDKGTRKITMSDYMTRLKDSWNLNVTEHSLKSFCKDLGRKGWSK